MTYPFKIAKIGIVFSACIMLMAGCYGGIVKTSKSKPTIRLVKIDMKCDTTGNEMGRIIFGLNISNQGSGTVTIAQSDSLPYSLQSKCYLISKTQLFPDALGLLIKIESKGLVLKSGESAKMNVMLDYDRLKSTLGYYQNKQLPYKAVQAFLDSGEFSIIYLQTKDSIANVVQKAPGIKCSCDHPF